MNSQIYDGFVIYAYVPRIPTIKQPEIEQKIQTLFSYDGWYYQDSCIYNENFSENFYAPVKVEFKADATEQEWEMGLDGYQLVFDCPFFAKDTRQNIFFHKNFCTEVLHKITWKKQAFYIIDGKLLPLPKTQRAKRKKLAIKQ